MAGQHHWLNGHESEQTLEIVKDREAWHDAVCGITESDMIQQLGNNNKAETESQMQKTNFQFPRDKDGGGVNWKIGTDIYTLLYIKQITKKDPLYSTGNPTQYPVMAYMEKESKKWIDVYV